MQKTETYRDVPAAEVETLVQDLQSEGASTEVRPQGPTLFTVVATWPDHVRATVASMARPPSTQQQTIQALINIFETGSVRGRYDQVTLIPGDSGGLTYGRAQTTLNAGGLGTLLTRYVKLPGARWAAELDPIATRARDKDSSLNADTHAHNLLRAAADDVLMRDVQDRYFDEHYFEPAIRKAAQLGFREPLSLAVVYDSKVHGSFAAVADATTQQHGAPDSLGERAWIQAYVQTRKAWLSHHERSDLQATVYRMQAFERLIALDQWALALPLVVRGLEISTATLSAPPESCWDGPNPGSRSLMLQSPLHRGLDVRVLQLALSGRKIEVVADGIFGQGSASALRTFQRQAGLAPTGVADAAVWAAVLT